MGFGKIGECASHLGGKVTGFLKKGSIKPTLEGASPAERIADKFARNNLTCKPVTMEELLADFANEKTARDVFVLDPKKGIGTFGKAPEGLPLPAAEHVNPTINVD